MRMPPAARYSRESIPTNSVWNRAVSYRLSFFLFRANKFEKIGGKKCGISGKSEWHIGTKSAKLKTYSGPESNIFPSVFKIDCFKTGI